MVPLKGIQVIDVSPLVPSSLASMLLGDFGADVIKVELPDESNDARKIWSYPDVNGMSSIFSAFNRNKRSVTIDLRKERGREVFLRLCAKADVVMEGFRSGVADEFGIGFPAVRKVNGGIIYCSLSGFGATSPYRSRPGHDLDFAALSGALSLTGNVDGSPSLPGYLVADFSGAMMATVAVLIALMRREREGSGPQHVDISLLDSVISLMGFAFLSGAAGDIFPRGNDLLFNGKAACYNYYRTRDDRYLVVTAMEPKYWEALCRALDREDLIGLHLEDESQACLKEELSAIFVERTLYEWMDLLGDEVCVSPVLTLDEVYHSEHTRSRGLFREIRDQENGVSFLQADNPILFTDAPRASLKKRPPFKGEHTSELLLTLGYSEDDLCALRRSSII